MILTKYTETQRFIDALRQMEGKPFFAHATDRAPCGYIPGAAAENEALADTFARICALPTTTERMSFLMATIEKYRRHVRLAEAAIRGESNPRLVGANASREAWSRIRPIEEMIAGLEQWRDQLHEAWMGEIGVVAIDQAAHARAAS
jgi:hypothetical protein